ncbi:MAG: ABC transporter permease [Bacilli bacterium]|nr:ABC transporter permease [Bacilli bacterium]
MNDMFVVAKFTLKDMLRRKAFIISTIIILLMIIIGCNIPNISKSFKGESVKAKILISDKNNIFENNLNMLSNDDNEIITDNLSIDEIKEKLLSNEIEEAVIVDKVDNNINFKYIVKNAMYMDGSPYIVDLLSNLYKEIQISKLNLSNEEVLSINPAFNYEIEQAEEEANGNVFVMMILSIVLFYAVYFCAFQVSSSITTEKTSKIIETLVTSTSPTNIVLGKTIGIGLAGLLQLILIILTAIFSVNMFLDSELVSSVLDMSSITIPLGLITLLYFILGYATYALLYALTGSTVSKPEDIQSANTPVAMITMIGFYISYFTMLNPSSNMNMIAGFIPISSPFCMPFRIMMGFANVNEVLISIGILLLTIFVISSITIKVYSNAILNYGSKMSFKDIVKMYKQK